MHRTRTAEIAAARRSACLARLRHARRGRLLHHSASRCGTWSRCAPRSATQRINLYGVSYGTRVAQHYLRRYPARVRARHPRRRGAAAACARRRQVALDAQSALQRYPRALRRRCRLPRALRRPAARLRRAARRAGDAGRCRSQLPDPFSGAPRQLDVRCRDHLATVLRLCELLHRLVRAAAAGAGRGAAPRQLHTRSPRSSC